MDWAKRMAVLGLHKSGATGAAGLLHRLGKTKSSVKRIAVLGLYNSGSTGVAGLLHRLGINMGPPFWENSDDASTENFYEAGDLADQLRTWWEEPRGVERVPARKRIRFLRSWAAAQECIRPGPVGAKHPLLSLSGDDLVAAWGPQTHFIWSWRPLDESIAKLKERGWAWSKGYEESLQKRLWDSLHAFESHCSKVVRFEWARLKSDPARGVRELASLVGLAVTEEQVQAAARFIRA
jgi:hypothetical protein